MLFATYITRTIIYLWFEKENHSFPLDFHHFLYHHKPIHANYSPSLVALINTEIHRNGVVLPWSNWWYDGPQPMRWRGFGLMVEGAQPGRQWRMGSLNMGKIWCSFKWVRFVSADLLRIYWSSTNMTLFCTHIHVDPSCHAWWCSMTPFRHREEKTRCDKLATTSDSDRIEQVEPLSPTRPTLKTILGQKPVNEDC